MEGELGEGQVFYLRENDENTEVNEHSTRTEEGVDVNEAAGPSDSKPLLGKGIWRNHKGMQLVHPFTHLESYKRRMVNDGRFAEDFVVALEPVRIISKPDVEAFVDILAC